MNQFDDKLNRVHTLQNSAYQSSSSVLWSMQELHFTIIPDIDEVRLTLISSGVPAKSRAHAASGVCLEFFACRT
jgi:hypothetical protein